MADGDFVDIPVKPATVARLQRNGKPWLDTFDSVINRGLDALEMRGSTVHVDETQAQMHVEKINPLNGKFPPNLAHTIIKSAEVAGVPLRPNQNYWNKILHALVRAEIHSGKDPEEIVRMTNANCVLGRKTDDGYRHLEDIGISIQGQDSNGAWRAIQHLADVTSCPVKIEFFWQENPKAAFPSQSGVLEAGRTQEGGL